MENKGKLILTEIFPSVQKHDIFLVFTVLGFQSSLLFELEQVTVLEWKKAEE